MNKILLGRLCAPDLDKDGFNAMAVPDKWPIHKLYRRILPLLKFSPNELLLGLVVNTLSTPTDIAEGAVGL